MEAYEIIKEHTIQRGAVDALVLEPSTVNRIVVNFTGMNPHKFDRWSWYYEKFISGDDTLFICLKDDEHLFFLDRTHCDDFVNQHEEFINGYVSKYNLKAEDVMTVGSSMGGYAAIYYAYRLSAKAAIVSNPLVNRACAALHKFSLWTRKIDEVGQYFVKLHDYVSRKKQTFVYIESGDYQADRTASLDLSLALLRIGNSYCHVQTEHPDHTDTIGKDKLFKIMDMVRMLV